MLGFFKKKDTRSLKFTEAKKLSCFSCGLYKHAQSPKMEPYGNFKKKVMVIGEAPGEREDESGKPFQGKTGRLLQRTLEEIGIDLFDDCLVLNAVNCHPPNNRQPSPNEIKACRDVKVLKAIEEYKPKMVLALGNIALTSLLASRWKATQLGGINKWAGWTAPDQDYQLWLCPTYHPSYVERMESPEVDLIWEQHLRNAFACLKKPFPVYKEPKIKMIDDLDYLYEIKTDLAAFDYEATGIKPQAPRHRIVCASIAYSVDEAVAFLMPAQKSKRKPFIDFLQNKNIKKVAANMKYEDTWSKVRLGVEVANWYHDTMLWAHVLDNRPGTTSLKFQSYVQFGLTNYEEDTRPYLTTPNKSSSNTLNKILDLLQEYGGKEQLLTYNGMDSVLELRLALRQMEIANELTERG